MIAEFMATVALAAPPPVEHPGETKPRPLISHVCDRSCRQRRYMRRVVRPYRATLLRIASCESGRRWHISTGNGFHGGLQFTASSWWAVGGSGYAHQASRLEQLYRAVLLMRLQGWGAWPVCRWA